MTERCNSDSIFAADSAETGAATTDHPRREFLCKIGALAGTAVLAPLAGCEVSELYTKPIPKGVTIPFDLAAPEYASLATVGGKALVNVDKTTAIVLVRTGMNEIIALNNACAHKQCPLDAVGTWDSAKSAIVCGCHGAAFGKDGTIVSQPANGDKVSGKLQSFKITFDGKKGTVTT